MPVRICWKSALFPDPKFGPLLPGAAVNLKPSLPLRANSVMNKLPGSVAWHEAGNSVVPTKGIQIITPKLPKFWHVVHKTDVKQTAGLLGWCTDGVSRRCPQQIHQPCQFTALASNVMNFTIVETHPCIHIYPGFWVQFTNLHHFFQLQMLNHVWTRRASLVNYVCCVFGSRHGGHTLRNLLPVRRCVSQWDKWTGR